MQDEKQHQKIWQKAGAILQRPTKNILGSPSDKKPTMFYNHIMQSPTTSLAPNAEGGSTSRTESGPEIGSAAPALPPTGPQSRLSPKADLIRKASARIPLTAEGIPVGFYRADFLDPPKVGETGEAEGFQADQIDQPANIQQQLSTAWVDLGFEQGYPTLPDGRPFWMKMAHEPGLCYAIFNLFLELDKIGPRELHMLAKHEEVVNIFRSHNGNASLSLAELEQEILTTTYEWYNLYCWKSRSVAHDLFKEAAHRHTRIRRAMSMEDYHYTTADRILRKIVTYMDGEDFVKDLNAKSAIDAFKHLVAIQRVSVGLPSSGPPDLKVQEAQETQFEMILRQIGSKREKGLTIDPLTGGGMGHPVDSMSEFYDDPNMASMMQELIVRVTERRHGAQDAAIEAANNDPLAPPEHIRAVDKRFTGQRRFGALRHPDLVAADAEAEADAEADAGTGTGTRTNSVDAEEVEPEAAPTLRTKTDLNSM